MTPAGSAGTASGSYRAEPEPRDEATEQLREALARKLSTWVIGVAYENSWLCADALLSGPLAPLLSRLAAVEAVLDEAEQVMEPGGLALVVTARVRRALDPATP